MARITQKEIHGVMTDVIEMDAPADELEDALRAQIAAEQAIESAETAQDAAERAEEAALRAEGNIAGVSSFNGRYGAVKPQAGDYTAKDVGALPLSGGTLSGETTLDGVGLRKCRTLKGVKYYGRDFIASVGTTEVGSVFDLYNEDTDEWLSRLSLTPTGLKLKVNGYSGNYDIYGEHNKPTGSYTGNGSATERTINVGGIGSVLKVWSHDTATIAFVFKSGAFVVAPYSSLVDYYKREQVYFENGVLHLITDSGSFNKNGTTFNYEF